MARLIGLTGARGSGKTTIATHLRERHGFLSVHPLAGGKAAARGYFRHLGATEDEALRMTDGDLKDAPSPLLPRQPDGMHATPRYFLEMLGNFMATTLGVQWTLGLEIDRLRREHPDRDLVVESIVYEADTLRNASGSLVGIERPGSKIKGLKTDEAVRALTPDIVFLNDGDDITEALERFDREVLALDAASPYP